MKISLALIAKGAAIATCAAFAAWLYLAAFMMVQDDIGFSEWITGEASAASFLFALIGSFAVGLPVALFTFLFSGRQLAQSVTTLAMVAVLAGTMMLLASFVVASEAGVMVLGIPAFIAALTFAGLGWFWILRPMR